MYDLVKNTVPILFYGAVFVNVFYQVKGDKMSLERKWLVSTLMVIFGGIFLFLSTMFMIQSIQHDSTRVDPFRVLIIIFSVALLITGIYLLIYCSKIKKK